jgi:hypothetical protein
MTQSLELNTESVPSKMSYKAIKTYEFTTETLIGYLHCQFITSGVKCFASFEKDYFQNPINLYHICS